MLFLVDFTGSEQIQHVLLGPSAYPSEQNDGEQNRKRKPQDTPLTFWQHNQSREQRPERESGIAAQLKQRLGQAVLAARSQASNAGRFRMKNRGARTDQRSGDEEHPERMRHRKYGDSDERKNHACRQGIRHRAAIGVESDQRLQERGRALVSECNQAYLSKIEMVRVLQ